MNELVKTIDELYAAFKTDAELQAGKNNKAAGLRARKVSLELEKKLKEIGLKVKSRPVEIGYEVRCQTPVAFDLVYCSMLGMGTYKLFSEGKTGCMVYVDPAGQISPLYLKDLFRGKDQVVNRLEARVTELSPMSDALAQLIEISFE